MGWRDGVREVVCINRMVCLESRQTNAHVDKVVVFAAVRIMRSSVWQTVLVTGYGSSLDIENEWLVESFRKILEDDRGHCSVGWCDGIRRRLLQ